jgi:thiamine biosynthesis protein ThiS
MPEIVVNGERIEIAAGITIAQLLEGLRIKPRNVAVERNRTLVPRAQHAACELQTGDQLEIVTLVGGG